MTGAFRGRFGAAMSARAKSRETEPIPKSTAKRVYPARDQPGGKERARRSGHKLKRASLALGAAHPLQRLRGRPHGGNVTVGVTDSQQAVHGMAADDRPAGVIPHA